MFLLEKLTRLNCALERNFEYFISKRQGAFRWILDQFQANIGRRIQACFSWLQSIWFGGDPVNSYPEIGCNAFIAESTDALIFMDCFEKWWIWYCHEVSIPEKNKNFLRSEYKYTTVGVDITSRPTLPRISFQTLLQQLNIIGANQYTGIRMEFRIQAQFYARKEYLI